ncbi:MAG: response regulator [Candidatus Aminicenantes bacterium]|nr:response regulator [Candidatus Aminicenantes bacterium]
MKKILIAEDKGHARNLLKVIFRLSGYKKLYFAKSGESCVRKMRRLKPDIILLNIDIPGKISGVNVIDTIKKESSTCSCNIILLSDKIDKKRQKELLKTGASDLITTPLKPVDVISKVENCIGKVSNRFKSNKENFVSFSPPVFQPVVYSERV